MKLIHAMAQRVVVGGRVFYCFFLLLLFTHMSIHLLIVAFYLCKGGSRSTVVVRWTADQQVCTIDPAPGA